MASSESTATLAPVLAMLPRSAWKSVLPSFIFGLSLNGLYARSLYSRAADAPNMLWVTDVTQFTMDGYKCWLSPVVDCFDGMVVSWTLSRSPNADMANRMLLDAVATLRDGEHPIIHSDRGCHYRWDEWIRICEEHGLIRSMSAKGCSPDNAAAEGFFGRLKNELFYGRDWRGVGYEEFRERLAAYLTHYNETRIKKSLDWMSPVQYRRSLGLAA